MAFFNRSRPGRTNGALADNPLALWLLAAIVALAALSVAVVGQAGLARADAALARAIAGLRSPGADLVMTFVTSYGDGAATTAAIAAAGLWLIVRGHWQLAVGMAIALGLTSLLVSALKVGFAIPRPNAHYAGGRSFSFPSGHTASAAALFGVLIWFALRGLSAFRGRWLAGVLLGCVGLIAASRLYLGVHWPSDVVGGLLLGAAVALGFALVFRRADPAPVAGGVLALALLVFAGVGTWHAAARLPDAMIRYAPASQDGR